MDAWKTCTEAESSQIWNDFDSRFRFRPSMKRFPGFTEPLDSVTYSIAGAYGDGTRYQEASLDLGAKLVAALRRCVPRDEFVFALDWQHPSYKFWPHRPFQFESEADWPVPALPNGDYYCFVSRDFSLGTLGHPWEMTICVFGKPLIAAFESDRPDLFKRPVRTAGHAV
jgi:hypothetical protein